jgi:hypothetical protein
MKQLLTLAFLIFLLPFSLLAQTPDKPLPPVIGAIAKPGELKTQIKSEEAKNYRGQTVTVCDEVMDARYLESSASQPTWLHMGAIYPNQHLTIFISKEVRATLGIKPKDYYKGKKICVSGRITAYKGKPQIVLLKKEDIQAE